MKTTQTPINPKTEERRSALGIRNHLHALGALSLVAAMVAACAGDLGKAQPVPVASIEAGPARLPTVSAAFTSVPDEGLTVSGTVLDASPSAKIIMLEQPDHGISTIALNDETIVQWTNRATIALTDISQGDSVKAHGHVGTPGTLLADEVIVRSP